MCLCVCPGCQGYIGRRDGFRPTGQEQYHLSWFRSAYVPQGHRPTFRAGTPDESKERPGRLDLRNDLLPERKTNCRSAEAVGGSRDSPGVWVPPPGPPQRVGLKSSEGNPTATGERVLAVQTRDPGERVGGTTEERPPRLDRTVSRDEAYPTTYVDLWFVPTRGTNRDARGHAHRDRTRGNRNRDSHRDQGPLPGRGPE